MGILNAIKKVKLNIPQARAFQNMRKLNFWLFSRGVGKSTGIAYGMRKQVTQMPRASFFLATVTYSAALSKTLPSTIEGLEFLGLYQGVDYVIGRCGKHLGFEMPFQPPNQWDNIIHWSNGTIHQLVSLDNPNSGRGLNSYGGIGDEAALLDETKLYNNVKITNRAKKEIFKNCSMLGAEIYATSMPMSKTGDWIFKMEERAMENPDEIYFGKANVYWNLKNLQDGYLEKMMREMPSLLVYNAEILNERPKVITDGFYGNLDSKIHYITDYDQNYLEGSIWLPKEKKSSIAFNCKQDNDLNKKAPLIVSLDFGVFNSMVVSQMDKESNTYRVLKSFWVKNPKITNDLFLEEFLPYYEPHQEKKIYLYGGHDGHNRTANSSSTLYQQLEALLRAHGWAVYVMAKPSAPLHSRKYLLLNTILKEVDWKLPKVRINKDNNPDLIIALERAEAIEGKTGIEKQKKDERNKSMMQQHTTHLTDAFDYPLYDMFWQQYDNAKTLKPGAGLLLFG